MTAGLESKIDIPTEANCTSIMKASIHWRYQNISIIPTAMGMDAAPMRSRTLSEKARYMAH
jgi:hypothetical protein